MLLAALRTLAAAHANIAGQRQARSFRVRAGHSYLQLRFPPEYTIIITGLVSLVSALTADVAGDLSNDGGRR
jgi:hypothetical protein